MSGNNLAVGDKVVLKINNQNGAIIAEHNDIAWVLFEEHRVPQNCDKNRLKKFSKFEHLRDLPVDTKVVVWGAITEVKNNRHFESVSDCGNFVNCFDHGQTSWTSPDGETSPWSNCEVIND